jgi:hypothetical protein
MTRQWLTRSVVKPTHMTQPSPIRLRRADSLTWVVENGRPTPLELIALVDRVREEGAFVLQVGAECLIVRQITEAFHELMEWLEQAPPRVRHLSSSRVAFRIGRACAAYLAALALPTEPSVLEVLPGGRLARRSTAECESLIEGFASAVRVPIEAKSETLESGLEALRAYGDQEAFVRAFEIYLKRCQADRRTWIAGVVERCRRALFFHKAFGGAGGPCASQMALTRRSTVGPSVAIEQCVEGAAARRKARCH